MNKVEVLFDLSQSRFVVRWRWGKLHRDGATIERLVKVPRTTSSTERTRT